MEECLLQKEKVAQELEEMKNKIEGVIKIYKDEIGKYQKKIIGEIQIPLYIYSGRVLQYYQGGLGIFVKYDTKGEKLDAIRLLSSNQSDHDILYTLSSGQLTGIIISLTLTLNKIYGTENFSCILIDDPVQTMDDLNIASLVELLRNEFKDYQMIMSTHEEDFSRFIRYKYEKYNLVTKRHKLNEMSWLGIENAILSLVNKEWARYNTFTRLISPYPEAHPIILWGQSGAAPKRE